MDKKELAKIISSTLGKSFIKKSSTWRLHREDIITVVNMQRSNFSNSYYINMGFFFKKIEPLNENPFDYQCHLRARIEAFLSTGELDRRALDFEDTTIDDMDRYTAIENAVKKMANVIGEVNSDDDVLRLVKETNLFKNMIPLQVKAYLGL